MGGSQGGMSRLVEKNQLLGLFFGFVRADIEANNQRSKSVPHYIRRLFASILWPLL